MKVHELIAQLEKVNDKNQEVFANHHVVLGNQGWHKTASKVEEVLNGSGAIVLDTAYTNIEKDVLKELK